MNLGDKTKSVTVRLSPSLHEFLKASASEAKVTPSQLIRMMLAGVKSLKESSASIFESVSKEINDNR